MGLLLSTFLAECRVSLRNVHHVCRSAISSESFVFIFFLRNEISVGKWQCSLAVEGIGLPCLDSEFNLSTKENKTKHPKQTKKEKNKRKEEESGKRLIFFQN